ncbi:MAG: acyl-[acyl-carrier-protein]--UDP-N-acetylglucosamine O-acyltransferase, partial [Gemmatimonadales bacterium]
MSRIHPTALVDPGAELGEGVRIGPFAIVGPAVQLGDEVEVGPRASVVRNTRLAAGVRVGEGSVIGGDPQDLKFAGEESWVEIGQGTVIREYSTVNRGTAASGVTRVGDGCFLMSYVHVAHDCHLG